MDGWTKAFTYFGFEDLDFKWERFLIYGMPAIFWATVMIWLVTQDRGLIFSTDTLEESLALTILAVPGTIRFIFLVALVPKGGGEWTPTWLSPMANPLNQRQLQGAHQVHSGNNSGTGNSVVTTALKVLIGLTLFAVCGGICLTGGSIVDPSDSTTEPARLRNELQKRHMLELINEARREAGVPPVVMGTNSVAQVQADQHLEDCVSSHWGTDGLKPYQRYSLAGGYQTNGENVLTFNECGLADTWLGWNDEPTEMVTDAVEGWLESPGHRKTMLNPEYRKVNIGLAWNRNVFKAIQHFEADYVEMNKLPAIEDGILELEGNLSSSYTFTGTLPLVAVIVYDPRPRRLTGGQLARTYCYGHGELIAAMIPPQHRFKDEFESTSSIDEAQCIDPYDVRRSAENPKSQEESSRIFEESKEESLQLRETEMTLSVRKAREMTADRREFSLVADVSELLQQHGDGVYTVLLWASLEGNGEDEAQTISEYSIFHGVRTPKGYGGN